jgi:nucleoside-diphosphate-sugar epimerase
MTYSEPTRDAATLLLRLSSRRIVVTGAGGFIGSTLLRFLSPYATDVRAVLGAPGDTVWQPPCHHQAYFADILDGPRLTELMQGADVVVHAAGSPSVRDSFDEPGKCAAVHVLGTVAVMQACRAAQVQRIVYLSSAEVYGRPSCNPVREDCPIRPLSPYGAAKASAETFVRTMALKDEMQCCILRPFSVYGPRQSQGSLVASILSQSMQGENIWLNDLKPVRDYCYVQDVAEAIAIGCVADLEDCTCNIGSGRGTDVNQLAEMILHLQRIEIPIRQKNGSDRPEGTEIYELIADIGSAATVLGWKPRTSLIAGLRETITWSQQRGS